MAKLADAADLKSADPKGLWGFKSPSRHHLNTCKYYAGWRLVDRTGIPRVDPQMSHRAQIVYYFGLLLPVKHAALPPIFIITLCNSGSPQIACGCFTLKVLVCHFGKQSYLSRTSPIEEVDTKSIDTLPLRDYKQTVW